MTDSERLDKLQNIVSRIGQKLIELSPVLSGDEFGAQLHADIVSISEPLDRPEPEPEKWWVRFDSGNSFYRIQIGQWDKRRHMFYVTQDFLQHLGITLPEPGECIEILPQNRVEMININEERLKKQIQELEDFNTFEVNRVRELNQEIAKVIDELQEASLTAEARNQRIIDCEEEIEKLRSFITKIREHGGVVGRECADLLHSLDG